MFHVKHRQDWVGSQFEIAGDRLKLYTITALQQWSCYAFMSGHTECFT